MSPPPPSSRKRTPNSLIIATFLIILACLALYAYHGELRCSIEEGPEISCCENRYKDCAPGSGFEAFGTLQSRVRFRISFTCPNRFSTTFFGILGLTLACVLLMISFFVRTELQALRAQSIAIGGLCLALLLLSSGLMIADVIRQLIDIGYFASSQTFHGYEPFVPLSYIANIVLNLIGIALVCFVTYNGYYCEGNPVNVSMHADFSQEFPDSKKKSPAKRSCFKKFFTITSRKSNAMIVITLIFTLLCIALYIYHAKPRCYREAMGVTIHGCRDEISDICTPGYAISSSGTLSGASWKTSLTCPFRGPTTVVGLFGLVGTLILLVLFFLSARGRSLRTPIIILGGQMVVLLSFSVGMMIADVVNGAKHAEEIKNTEIFSPETYYVNIISTGIVIVLIGFIIIFGFNFGREADASLLTSKVRSGISQEI